MKTILRRGLWALILLLGAYGCGQDTPTINVNMVASTPTALPTSSPTAMPTSTPAPTKTGIPSGLYTPTPLTTSTSLPLPTPPTPGIGHVLPDLFSGGPSGGAASGGDVIASSVEDVLEQGLRLAGASPVHIAFRGTADEGSVRCEWRGIARTLGQREAAIRFWLDLDDNDPLPSPADAERRFSAELDRINAIYPATLKSNFSAIARGGLTTGYVFLACYADYAASEFLVGSGPTDASNRLVVAYDRMGEARSYELYKMAHAGGRVRNRGADDGIGV